MKKFEDAKGGNQKLQSEEGQTAQWPKEKGQRTANDLPNNTQKSKDCVTRSPIKTELTQLPQRMSSCCSLEPPFVKLGDKK